HAALYMEMTVDKSRDNPFPPAIYLLPAAVPGSYTDYPALVYGDIAFPNLATEDIHDLSGLQYEIRGDLPSCRTNPFFQDIDFASHGPRR
ncbi:MAG: hypothetical protein PHY54_20875, partial [Methylococcales bacterium]|nr:hypothetical protein [Methylococcales bacterium]